jgi:GNAT superfamily N-acetyltransferase
MYKLLKAREVHLPQILPHLSITCYWKEFVEGNSLNKSYEDFMMEWIIKPRLPYMTVLIDENEPDKVRGSIITATTEQFAAMPDYTPHLHSRVMEVFAPWFEYKTTDSVVVELFVVDEDLRGQGFGSKLYQVAEDLAKTEGKDCISGFIWACFPVSLINATKKGRMVTGCIKFADPVKIPLLYLEKKPEFSAMKDYFQTEEYANTRNMLLK